MTPDSATSNKEYAERAKELGHGILSSVEHGFQGRYYETYELAKSKGLKFIFGTEAYWVKDRLQSDSTNSHIILLAKTEKGRRAINSILSDANIDGYYYKPRVDLSLLLSLPKDDVFVTTACVAFWRYDDIESIVKQLHDYFGHNFMLETQYHNTDIQKELNAKILLLSKIYDIDIIHGCDSHFIYPSDSTERDNILEAKHIHYDDEDGCFMDYPDGEEAIRRYKQQGVLSDEQIKTALNNTNIVLSFDDIVFDKNIKLPTLYPACTQEEKDKIFTDLVWKCWDEVKHEVPETEYEKYENEIKKETSVIINTKMADYFLLDYALVKKGIEKGGIITRSGRGSGVSYYSNRLLGFTKIDRISAQVKMYPERFISETRILQTRSLPDLDLNLGTVEIFAEAQKELLGEGHSYPMIAFGTFKVKSAFKLYARAKKLDFEIANTISEQLEKYEKALKYAEEDDKDLIDITDFVDSEYMYYIEESKKYQGIISDKKAHPCGYLIYSGDIKSELGLIKCVSESTKKEVITTVIDGAIAENYKFLKNDLLKVDVVLNNAKVYEKIGKEPLSIKELLKECHDNKKVWDIYTKGLTQCINQVEKSSTTEKVMRYKPQNISELTAFVAGIRPSFKSMYHVFEKRVPFTYDIKAFDKILQTEELPYSFVLYQEQIMATLQYAGFPADETYGIIKAIAKKHPEIVSPLKEKFKQGFSTRIKQEEPNLTIEEVNQRCDDVWKIIDNSAQYGFNASHAYSVACDSLDGAYLKATYPFEFYEVMLNAYTEKGNKDKVASLLSEMEKGFGIKLGKYRFRNDNRGFVADKENNTINPSIKSIKFLNQQVAEEFYELGKNTYSTFTDLLIDIAEKTSCNTRQMNILISLNYFKEFGGNKKLLEIYALFDKRYSKTHTDKTKVKRIKEIQEFEVSVADGQLNPKEQIKAEIEYIGYAETTIPKLSYDYVMAIDLMTKYKNPIITFYHIKNGDIEALKIKKHIFDEDKIELFDVIKIVECKSDFKYRKTDTGYEKLDTKELFLVKWSRVK
jgi:DNA polymerase III alpha subunit